MYRHSRTLAGKGQNHRRNRMTNWGGAASFALFTSFGVLHALAHAQGPELCVTDLLSGGTELALCGDPPFHATPNDVGSTQLLAVDGPEVIVVLWEEQTPEGLRPFYAVTRDGETFPIVRSTSYDLRLKYATFDPAAESLNVEGELLADESCNLHVVQFVAPSMPEFRDAVSATGGVIRGFLPNHSHLVEMDAAAKAQVETLPWVRAVTPYHPAYRLEPYLRENLADAENLFPLQRYNIMVAERGLDQKNAVADRITQLGGTVEDITPCSSLLEATLTPEELLTVASYNEVIYIDRWGEPMDLMDYVRELHGANYLSTDTVQGYTGQGVRGMVSDSSLRTTHVAFPQDPTLRPIIRGELPGGAFVQIHGTNVFGTLFGNGTSSPVHHPEIPPPRGILPDGQGIFSSYLNLTDPERPENECCLACELISDDCDLWCSTPDSEAPYEAIFQTRSWTLEFTTIYGTRAALLDDVVFTYDLLICQAQGNCGNDLTPSNRCVDRCNVPGSPQCAAGEAWAKNVVSVGGVYHAGPGDEGPPFETDRGNGDPDDDHARGRHGAYATLEWPSVGPAADGRFKPDLAHFYDAVQAPTVSPLNPDHSYTEHFGGTSAATPTTCGIAGLLHQMWADGLFGNPYDPEASVFANRPHAATAKAMMINTAKRYTWNPIGIGLNDEITRNVQGWGLSNAKKLYNIARRGGFLLTVDEAHPIEFGRNLYTVNVPSQAFSLNITLVWRDPAANPAAAMARVNDLGVYAYHVPTGILGPNFYLGNKGLGESNWSLAGGGEPFDDINTVENIFVPNPPSGEWRIGVSAYEINENGNPQTPYDDAVYALVVSVDFDCNNNGVPDSEEFGVITTPYCSGGGNPPPGNEPPHNQMPPDPPGTGLE